MVGDPPRVLLVAERQIDPEQGLLLLLRQVVVGRAPHAGRRPRRRLEDPRLDVEGLRRDPSAFAICWRISAEGFRRPLSIWLRYGFEIPASSDSRLNDSRARVPLLTDELTELRASGPAGAAASARACPFRRGGRRRLLFPSCNGSRSLPGVGQSPRAELGAGEISGDSISASSSAMAFNSTLRAIRARSSSRHPRRRRARRPDLQGAHLAVGFEPKTHRTCPGRRPGGDDRRKVVHEGPHVVYLCPLLTIQISVDQDPTCPWAMRRRNDTAVSVTSHSARMRGSRRAPVPRARPDNWGREPGPARHPATSSERSYREYLAPPAGSGPGAAHVNDPSNSAVPSDSAVLSPRRSVRPAVPSDLSGPNGRWASHRAPWDRSLQSHESSIGSTHTARNGRKSPASSLSSADCTSASPVVSSSSRPRSDA